MSAVNRGRVRAWVLRLAVVALAACTPAAPPATALATTPPDLEIVWDVTASTDEGGLGWYYNDPGSRHLRPGPVFVAWTCSGAGAIRFVPGTIDHPPHTPAPESPLGFTMTCPTVGDALVGWQLLEGEAVGGENMLHERRFAGPLPSIAYRVVVAQRSAGASL